MANIRYPESGSALRAARRSRLPSISQERLAEAVGITRRHMIRLENGEHRPSGDLRDKIAVELGVDPSALPAEEGHADPFRDAA